MEGGSAANLDVKCSGQKKYLKHNIYFSVEFQLLGGTGLNLDLFYGISWVNDKGEILTACFFNSILFLNKKCTCMSVGRTSHYVLASQK